MTQATGIITPSRPLPKTLSRRINGMCHSKANDNKNKVVKNGRWGKGSVSFAEACPHLVNECNGWDPRSYTCNSGIILSWKCSNCMHVWEAPPDRRTRGNGCKKCGIIKRSKSYSISSAKKNNLADRFPEIAKECDNTWDPSERSAFCNDLVGWTCGKCSTHFQQRITNRTTRGDGCPKCGRKKQLVSHRISSAEKNNLAKRFPKIASECDGSWDPKKYPAGCTDIVGWWCKNCCKVFHQSILNRTSRGSGCPDCARYGFKKKAPSFFYLVEKPDRFKFGIANHGSRRLDQHRRVGWDLIESIDMAGSAAWALERAVEAAFNSKGIPLGQFRETFHGFTESWYKHHLEVRTIRGLCRKLRVNLAEFLAM